MIARRNRAESPGCPAFAGTSVWLYWEKNQASFPFPTPVFYPSAPAICVTVSSRLSGQPWALSPPITIVPSHHLDPVR